MINIDVNELKFFFNKKYRDAFIDNIVNQRDDLKKELEEAKKVIDSYKETNLQLLEE